MLMIVIIIRLLIVITIRSIRMVAIQVDHAAAGLQQEQGRGGGGGWQNATTRWKRAHLYVSTAACSGASEEMLHGDQYYLSVYLCVCIYKYIGRNESNATKRIQT